MRGLEINSCDAGYEVLGLSARLVGVPFPTTEFFTRNQLTGIRWIACLASENPERRYAIGSWPIDFVIRAKIPDPIRAGVDVIKKLTQAALLIQARLKVREGVIVHCDMGIDRTSAVVGTVLALEGYAPEDCAQAITQMLIQQQPGWIGEEYVKDLIKVVRDCATSISEVQKP